MLTRETLLNHIAHIRSQIIAYQGALQFAETLLRELESPSDAMTLPEVAEMIAGPGATAELQKVKDTAR